MIVNDNAVIDREKKNHLPLPIVRKVDQKEINTVHQIIKQDVQDIVDVVMEEVPNDPVRGHLVVKGKGNH